VIVAPSALAPQTGRLLDDRFRRSFNLAAVPPVSPTIVVARMALLCWLGEPLQSTDEIRMTGSAQAAVISCSAPLTCAKPCPGQNYPGTLRGAALRQWDHVHGPRKPPC
jgi:hypothetical protein